MDFLRCAWCELNQGAADPPFPHTHLDGEIPVTPCRRCSVANHEACEPIAPWWCSCDCGLKENDDDPTC